MFCTVNILFLLITHNTYINEIITYEKFNVYSEIFELSFNESKLKYLKRDLNFQCYFKTYLLFKV